MASAHRRYTMQELFDYFEKKKRKIWYTNKGENLDIKTYDEDSDDDLHFLPYGEFTFPLLIQI